MEIEYQSIKKAEKKNKQEKNRKNEQTETKIKISFLGGLDRVGMNMTVLEDKNSLIVVDVGSFFDDRLLPGVERYVPDFSYLKKPSFAQWA